MHLYDLHLGMVHHAHATLSPDMHVMEIIDPCKMYTFSAWSKKFTSAVYEGVLYDDPANLVDDVDHDEEVWRTMERLVKEECRVKERRRWPGLDRIVYPHPFEWLILERAIENIPLHVRTCTGCMKTLKAHSDVKQRGRPPKHTCNQTLDRIHLIKFSSGWLSEPLQPAQSTQPPQYSPIQKPRPQPQPQLRRTKRKCAGLRMNDSLYSYKQPRIGKLYQVAHIPSPEPLGVYNTLHISHLIGKRI